MDGVADALRNRAARSAKHCCRNCNNGGRAGQNTGFPARVPPRALAVEQRRPPISRRLPLSDRELHINDGAAKVPGDATLRQHGYPLDQQGKATDMMLGQAALLVTI